MAYELPSLNALRAFEAAARHLSFARAADELCVTPGAISRHVSILEESLRTQLFIRTHRQVQLTAPALSYLEAIQSGFKMIDQATREFDDSNEKKMLRVTATPSFASQWLLPRMHRLASEHPDLEIQLETSFDPVNFSKDKVDISIETAASKCTDTNSVKLADVELIPVCHPRMVNGRPPPSDISELGSYTLLQVKEHTRFWSFWAETAGCGDISTLPSSCFPTLAFVYQAAREGFGIGMGIKCLLEEDLANQALIAPFANTVRYPAGFFLITPNTKLRPHVARFRDWVLEEAAGLISQSAAA